MQVTVTIDVDGKVVKDSRDLALALVSAAADIDHGASLGDETDVIYANVMLHGQRVGKVTYGPVILPVFFGRKKPKTAIIQAGSLREGNIVIQSGIPWKVGEVLHTDDGYTYWQGRTLTGHVQAYRHCALSAGNITVEVR